MSVALPIVNAPRWIASELAHGAGCVRPGPIAFVRGEGSRLFTETGEAYLDASASYGVASLGHAHPEITEAVARQASQLVALTPSFANDVRAAYLDELQNVLPESLDRAFLCNSGTESIEAALKIARWSTGRTGVIAALRGFHGRSMGSLSATAEPKYREPFAPLVPGFRHVRHGDVEALAEAIGPETAAVLLEVIQGEGGVRPSPDGYLERVRELCDANGALLIFDEVQTGFCRTGSFFAFQASGVVPDLLALGKGIAGGVAMGATVFGPRIGALSAGSHGSTFGGNPLACAAARATLRVMQRDRLDERAAELGAIARVRLQPLVDAGKVREVRGRGLMIGIETRGRVAPVRQELLNRRILTLAAGLNVLRLLPPLTIHVTEWNEVIDQITGVLS
ncbi:Acetylornithine/acetyl-lysine aminotransferase [Planctomycetes bacterium Poly30]|uniref:Acetylornithine/acetyl-lysine aminotransferase n=1 Tax=Saltatorellus ferox TaxID=2528018 RepID=A0A518EYN7_9BACT|nr:Acetylornithine/acetyl-lysine aminotransferase [Planctomycetes bacterium Poly30]